MRIRNPSRRLCDGCARQARCPPDPRRHRPVTHTEAILRAADDHLLAPYHPFDHDLTDRLVVASAEGVQITDTDGRTYLDAIGGMWCTNIGTGRDEMADAIAAQVRKLSFANPFTDMMGAPAVELASKLATLAPGDLNHVFFTTGGSTAVDAAFRLVQFYNGCLGRPEKRHILSREDAYHGSTYAAVSIGGKKSDHMAEFQYIDDIVHHLSSPNFYRHGAGRTEAEFAEFLFAEFEAKVSELGAENVAAFFAEP
ncbi:MAG: aminotransferase class III-fold pyridoxal phosphate-dependent enzyme, partial [Acidimicrobiia bacterium]|nr:aminotransferase class III-fold pyridoxal phosphate-dependent enzyme [Acidimicrobiia bacterium]